MLEMAEANEVSVVETFLSHLKQGNVRKELFQAGLTNVQGGLSDGLPADILQSFVDVILASKLSASNAIKLVGCLIPEHKIDNNIIDRVLLWIISNHRKKPISVVSALLRWLIGVLEYGLADTSHVDQYYDMIWGLLKNEKLERATCHLIHMLTRPEDVYRGRVQTILKMHEINGKARHTMALISLFKSYKPEDVPENIQIRSLQGTFKVLPHSQDNYFKLAQLRLQNESIPKSSKFECLWSRPFVSQKIIPDAAYVHLGSVQYLEKKRKVIQCLDKRSLLHSQQSIELPSQVLTLLLNEGGIHLLATHNRDVHLRFSYVVYDTLYNVFINQRVNVNQQECEFFLKQLVDLEDYMQQGIPVISRFLYEFVCTWDGLQYRELIYRLLERMTFKSFDELKVFILDYLNTLFITGSIEEQCLIVRTLKILISNMFNQRQQAAADGEDNMTFLGLNFADTVDLDSVLPQLTDFVGKMCRKGLQITNGHPLLLHACIDFYDMVADVEDHETSWSILPRACVYRCLLGPSTSMLSRTCELLLKYYQTYQKMKSMGQHNLFKTEMSVLEEYSYDIYNCLVRDMALSKADQGYIFENLPKDVLCIKDTTFSVTDTVIMGSMAEFIQKASSESGSYEEALVAAFKSVFPSLCEYLDLVVKKVGN